MSRLLRLIFIIFFTLLITQCGFHLRGPTTLSPPLKRLYLKTTDPYGQLTQELKRYLKLSDVELVDSPEDASTVLEIIRETNGQQLLSVSGTQQTRQYNLVLTAFFRITDPKGKVLIPTQTVSEERALTVNSNQILAGSNEADAMFQQMRQALVFDIMNRLSSQTVTETLEQHS